MLEMRANFPWLGAARAVIEAAGAKVWQIVGIKLRLPMRLSSGLDTGKTLPSFSRSHGGS